MYMHAHTFPVAFCILPFLSALPSLSPGRFTVTGVTPNEEGEARKVKVKVRESIHGTFFVKSASMLEKIKPEEEEEAMETDGTDQGGCMSCWMKPQD